MIQGAQPGLEKRIPSLLIGLTNYCYYHHHASCLRGHHFLDHSALVLRCLIMVEATSYPFIITPSYLTLNTHVLSHNPPSQSNHMDVDSGIVPMRRLFRVVTFLVQLVLSPDVINHSDHCHCDHDRFVQCSQDRPWQPLTQSRSRSWTSID